MPTSAEPRLDRPAVLLPVGTADELPPEPALSLEPVEFDLEGRLPPFPHLLRHPLRASAWIVRAVFGIASLVLMLSLLAAVPIVNFVTLGYLLELKGASRGRDASAVRFRCWGSRRDLDRSHWECGCG